MDTLLITNSSTNLESIFPSNFQRYVTFICILSHYNTVVAS